MLETSARLLRLLSLLQSRPRWSGPDLAERLEVTDRTVRRDVERLRRLGYPVAAEPGVEGGYRLGQGGELPPLLLDDEEAVAVAVTLGVAARVPVEGVEEAGVRALAKLERLLPPRLRTKVEAIRHATVRLGGTGDAVAAELLVTLSTAIAGHERVAVAYRDREGRTSDRRVEPYQLVSTGRRWYLLCVDVDRADWRTFRVDRIAAARATGHRFAPVPSPDGLAVVQRAITVSPYRIAAKVRVSAPLDVVRAQLPATVASTEPDGAEATMVSTGADDGDVLLGHLVALGQPFEVVEPPELRRRAAAIGRRLARLNAAQRAQPERPD